MMINTQVSRFARFIGEHMSSILVILLLTLLGLQHPALGQES